MKLIRPLIAAALVLVATASSASAVTLQMATVGDLGNAADTTGYGRVNYQYDIGKHHVTIEQYCEFLNAVAKTDTYGLYSDEVNWAPISGISRTGSPGSYVYTPTAPVGPAVAGITAGNRPITKLNWFSAARFANWMTNGQPTGAQGPTTTEQGAYALNGKTTGAQVPRNGQSPLSAFATLFVIPTENEWYKAAYYKGGSTNAGYWNYATQNDTLPGNDLSTSGSNVANYYYWTDNPPAPANTHLGFTINPGDYPDFVLNHLTAVGMFAGTTTAYGVYDMNGNAFSWLETPVDPLAVGVTFVRGGEWGSGWNPVLTFSRNYRVGADNTELGPNLGIRLATVAPVPEPSTAVLAAGGAAAALALRRHRRRLFFVNGSRIL